MSDDILKREQINELLDNYGKLLTPLQCKICEDYFIYNLSLSEIADSKSISRSAVLDTIKKSTKKLEEFESKLGLVELSNEELKLIGKLKINSDPKQKEIVEELERIIKDGI